VSPTVLEVSCSHCGREAPTEVVRHFQAQLESLEHGPGMVVEAGESDPPGTWTMRTGGGLFGVAKYACPQHRVPVLYSS
jgi:hypothetical protein